EAVPAQMLFSAELPPVDCAVQLPRDVGACLRRTPQDVVLDVVLVEHEQGTSWASVVDPERSHLHELELDDIPCLAGEKAVELTLKVRASGLDQVLEAVRRCRRLELQPTLRRFVVVAFGYRHDGLTVRARGFD